MSADKLEALLDSLIDSDPDAAERLIEKHLGRLALKKRLQEFKAEKQVASWKLVPEVATHDMELAGIKVLPNAPDVAHWWVNFPKAVYQAMLAAAPSADKEKL